MRRSAELLRCQSSIRRRQVEIVEEVKNLDAKGQVVAFARTGAAAKSTSWSTAARTTTSAAPAAAAAAHSTRPTRTTLAALVSALSLGHRSGRFPKPKCLGDA